MGNDYWTDVDVKNYFKNKEPNPKVELLAMDLYELGVERIAFDVGCGYGRNLKPLVMNGWKVIAIDSNEDAVADVNSAYGLKYPYCAMPYDLCSYPTFGFSFPLIIADGILHQLDFAHYKKTISYFDKIVNPGGILFASIFTDKIFPGNCTKIAFNVYENFAGLRMTLLGESQIKELFIEAGFVIQSEISEVFSLEIGVRSNITMVLKHV